MLALRGLLSRWHWALSRLDPLDALHWIGLTALAAYPVLRFGLVATLPRYAPTVLDELLVLALLPLAALTLIRGETLPRLIAASFALYAVFGLLGALVFRNPGLEQPLAAVVDIALDSKLLILCFGATAVLRWLKSPALFMRRAAVLIVGLAAINGVFVLRDLFFSGGIGLNGLPLLPRLGLVQPRGVLGHHLESLWLTLSASFAAAYLVRVTRTRWSVLAMLALAALVLAHLSAKEAIAMLFGLPIIFIGAPTLRRLLAFAIPLGVCGALAVWVLTPIGEVTLTQIEAYTGAGGPALVRNVLTREAFSIANEHFPLGSGAGSYASPPSFQFGYSDVYVRYGLSSIWGASIGTANHLLDVFWPKVIAQAGYFGAFFYLVALLLLGRPAVRGYLEQPGPEGALAVATLIAWLIISVAATPFTHEWLTPVLAVVLAYHMAQLRRPEADQ
jgi:hypothetical protein